MTKPENSLETIESIIEKLLAFTQTLGIETVSLSDGLGRVLAEDLKAQVTMPPESIAATDGFALHTAEIMSAPVTLPVIGESRANAPFTADVTPGCAVRVFSGSPIPHKADIIIPYDQVTIESDTITINSTEFIEDGIYHEGLDFSEGDICLKRGDIMTARKICLAAAMNAPWFSVYRKPRVAIFTTGSELVMPGMELATKGHAYASTNLALVALAQAYGGTATNLGIAADEKHAIQRFVRQASTADLLLSTGSISESAGSLYLDVLTQEGYLSTIHQIAIGEHSVPFLIAHKQNSLLLGFPGNPVQCILLGILILRTLIAHMMGVDMRKRPKTYATLDRNLDVNDLKLNYLRARISRDDNNNPLVIPVSSFDNLMISTFAMADCLVKVDQNQAKRGDTVEIIPLLGSIFAL